jgi:hypothetical protein
VQFCQFLSRQLTILTPIETSQSQRSVSLSFQFHDLMTDTGEEPTNFAVLAFGHGDLNPGAVFLLLCRLHRMNTEFPFREEETFPQLLVDVRAWLPGHLRDVGTEDPVAGMTEFLREIPVIGDNDQACRVFIEATDGEKARTFMRKQIENESASFRVVCGAQIA